MENKLLHRTIVYSMLLGVLITGIAVAGNPFDNTKEDGLYAYIKTTKGTIALKLEFLKTPMTVCSFVGLAEGTINNTYVDPGVPFFDGLVFHRYVQDWVIQDGDPDGNGSGGPGYEFPNEIHPELKHDSAGVLGMANAGPGTNGSQYYITLEGPFTQLDGDYTVFGATAGDTSMDVAMSIRKDDAIQSVTIERVGAAAEAFKTDQAAFDSLVDWVTGVIEEGTQKVKQSSVIWKIINGKISCFCMIPVATIDLAVYTMNGRELYSVSGKKISSRIFTVPYHFKQGMYLLNMKIGKNNITQKFVVPLY